MAWFGLQTKGRDVMATHIWNGAVGNWSNPADWLPSGAIPQNGDTVLIGAGDVTLSGLLLQSQTIVVSGTSSATVEFNNSTLNAASSLSFTNVSEDLNVTGTSTSTGTITLDQADTMQVMTNSSFINSGVWNAATTSNFEPSPVSLMLDAGASFDNEGTMVVSDQLTAVSNGQTLINNGTIVVNSTRLVLEYPDGAKTITNVTGVGVITLNSAHADLGGLSATETLAFNPNTYSFVTLAPSVLTSGAFAGQITGFFAGSTIDLGTSFVNSLSYSASSHVLTTFYNGIQTGTLAILGNYQTSNFSLTGSVLTTNVVCFAEGTCIATRRGAISVDQLRIGEEVRTRDGWRPVRWLGQRRVDCASHPHPGSVWPIRLRAGAFGASGPERDLELSPEHAVFTRGVLIPVEALVNGVTISQVQRPLVTYWHVELETHDVIFAEGLAVESYMENGNRQDFDATETNAGPLNDMPPCAPILRQGPVVEAVRATLRAIMHANHPAQIENGSLLSAPLSPRFPPCDAPAITGALFPN